MPNLEQFFELNNLENEILVGVKLLVDDGLSDDFFEVHESLTRRVDAWE